MDQNAGLVRRVFHRLEPLLLLEAITNESTARLENDGIIHIEH